MLARCPLAGTDRFFAVMARKGYTLIELVVVIALLGLMLVFTMPRLRDSLLTNDLKASTRRIIALVKEVRNTAGREYKNYLLHIDIGQNRLWYGPEGMNDTEEVVAAERAVYLPEDVRIQDVRLWSQGKKALDEAVLRFSKKGYVEQTLIHLEARDGRQVSLLLTPFLGKIKTYDKYVEMEGQE